MFKLFLFYLILIAYSVEILLFIFTTDQQKSMVDIKNTRIEIAKKRNIKYDTRSAEEFFFDSKKIHKDLGVTDRYFSYTIPDPYRWLEDDSNNQITNWIEAQNNITNQYLNDISVRDTIEKKLKGLL